MANNGPLTSNIPAYCNYPLDHNCSNTCMSDKESTDKGYSG